ncbi:MAG: SpoIIE family protein phosphatase [Bacteroidia bacterium]
MRNLINSVVHIGITPDLPFNQKNKVRIFNTASLTIAVICIFYALFGLYQHRYLTVVFTLSEFLLLLVGFWFVHKEKFNFAFHFGLISGLLFLVGYSILFGERSQTHIFLLFMPVGAVIFFDSKKTILFYFIICALLLAASRLIFGLFEPYYPYNSIIDAIGWMNFIFTSTLIFLGVKQFKLENVAFNDKLDLQRKQLKEKNKEITDSFHYAQRIQKALMASNHSLTKNLPDYFVLYLPKDIVSCDFYWAEEKESRFLLAVCDCTGHGVPGAFMSLLNITKLNETVREKKITTPNLIFNEVRDEIIKALNPEGNQEQGRDGMDAIFCSFDFANKKLQYACANNPILIIRDGKIIETPVDKMPVGMYVEPKIDFTLQSFDLQAGDVLYLFTDGYADQFGGPKGKKFKYAQLKETLLNVYTLPMNEQQLVLQKIIESWKANLEQVDDILILGVKIN